MFHIWTGLSIHRRGGYTLIETVVAIALLVTVLAPTGALLAHFMVEHQAARQARALTLAETALEEMILQHAREGEAPADRDEMHRAWRIVRSSQAQGRLVALRVAVYWKDREAPTVVLQTMRKRSGIALLKASGAFSDTMDLRFLR